MVQCPNCKISAGLKYPSLDRKFDIYFCKSCLYGFTFPIPKNLGKYYHSNYWISPGILGLLKNLFFKAFQLRRKYWVNHYLGAGKILDIGAGEARFAKSLGSNFKVISIDPSSKIRNKDVIKVNFLRWNTRLKFDAIVFWESLEHTENPQQYLKKASKLLREDGLIFIEYPRFDSFEAKVFGKYWFHLDPPRHLSHLTKKGLEKMLDKVKLKSLHHLTTSAFDYSLWGFIASVLNLFGSKKTDSLKHRSSISFLILISPLALLAFFLQVLLRIINQASIGLIIAKKM